MRQIKITHNITNRQDTSMECYLQEISREPLLTTDEETHLAQLIHQGNEEAVEKLTRANLRFVISVAKQYQGQGLSLTDLINEGNMGLITAARRFDETRGFKFISYAVWWIRQAILQALAEKGRLVRLPGNHINNVSKVNRFYNQFVQKNERLPTIDEIAEEFDIQPMQINQILLVAGKHVSMDSPIIEDEDNCLLNLLASNSTTDNLLVNESLTNEIDRAINHLPEREGQIIRMFFGIHSPEMTLDDISAQIGISRERVRQIKEKGLSILRSAHMSHILRQYL